MSEERRNLYRLLHVQPEAPSEIIKASYRTLMSALKAHPDLGGDTARAAQINAAYATLSDPEQRQAYDHTRQPRPRGATSTADAAGWWADRRCPLCASALPARVTPARCANCDSPLQPAPATDGATAEPAGRRRAPRHPRELALRLHLPGEPQDQAARLLDLSFSGLSLACAPRLAKGSTLRAVAPGFDTVAQVVACRSVGAVHRVHARLLTLHLVPAARGVYVSAKV